MSGVVNAPLGCPLCAGMGEVRVAPVTDQGARWFPRRYAPCPRCMVAALEGRTR